MEAPIASGYSGRVLEEAAKRFPGVKVKAVVSTSDAWPHVGGLREYAARGIPLHVLDLNRPLVERLLKAPRTRVPDALAKAPRAAKLRAVARRSALGTGKNRLELIPVRTETGERMLFVWLPEHRLLYTSDLVQPMPGGAFFNVQQVGETVDVAARENLVRRLSGLGMRVLPSQANFIFASHPAVAGADLYAALRKRRILVRYFAKPRIDQFLRITVGTESDCERLYTELAEILRNAQ